MASPSPAATAGVKRKRPSDTKYYAVHRGKSSGVFPDWAQCQAQISGYKGAVYKSFSSLSDAQAFVANGLAARTSTTGPQKWYAVRVGKIPGVYASWAEASANVTGCKAPKYKAFATKAEAESFVHAADDEPSQDADEVDILGAKSAKKKTAKRAKDGVNTAIEFNGPEPGDDLLPAGTADGFDSRLRLDPVSGHVEYKTQEQLHATKQQASGLADDGVIKIWTDGSSRGNGTAGAVAGVGVYFGPGDGRNLAEPLAGARQTNQRAELTAVLRALELSPRDREIMVLSDSSYAINCVTKWFQKWRSNGWMNSSNKAVENRDLIERIIGLIEEREKINRQLTRDGPAGQKRRAMVSFVWVKGHSNDAGNNAADALAVAGAGMSVA